MKTNQKFYIFRTYSAGVFFGNKKFIPADVFYNDENQKGKTPVLVVTNCRRLWSWSGAASLTQLAVEGTKNPSGCKFTMTVTDEEGVYLPQVVEVIPCTQQAVDSINSVPVWKI